MSFDSQSFLETLTQRAGVYQMFDASEELIYVGKAKNLKNRVSSYFRARGLNDKTVALVARIARIETIVTSNETEALLLEQTLIKQHRPQYNILLKDDKSYPFIHVSEHEFPLLSYKRGQRSKKGRYYGPYPNAYAVKESLNYLQQLFKIRNCQDSYFKNRSRACLQYQIKRCSGPCVGHISAEEYQADVGRAELFLKGKSDLLIKNLEKDMEAKAAVLEFEYAGEIRDRILHLRKLQEKQYVSSDKGEADAWAVSHQQGIIGIQRMIIRSGVLIASKCYFPENKLDQPPKELLFDAVAQYYFSSKPLTGYPAMILMGLNKDKAEVIASGLTEIKKMPVEWVENPRAERKKWLQLAVENAETSALARAGKKGAQLEKLSNLKDLLSLDEMPDRIECFDISHSKGEATVASCVVFDKTGVRKDLYRRFNIKGITPGDDYAAIQQAVFRHFSRLKEAQQQEPERLDVMPSILLIDGAKGQINHAQQALSELGIVNQYVLGISKGETRKSGWEFLWELGEQQPILPNSHNSGFLLLQEIRDEAHRFAITGHRKQRAKARLTSGLEGIPGIGPKRRRELLRYFGSMNAIKGASLEEITKVPGINTELAGEIYAAFNGELK